MSDRPADHLLFTYGTLQDAEVQRGTFGRLVAGERDALPGYTIDYVERDDHGDVGVSGPSVHPVLRATGRSADTVTGLALHVTDAELDAADEHELPRYRRTPVRLASGRDAWVYVR